MPGERRIALLAMEPKLPDGGGVPFSYGIRRVEASLLADPALRGAAVQVVDSATRDVDAWVAEVEAADHDLVGLGTHVWSFPTFVEVARRLKANRPSRTIVLTGPIARPAMFALAPWRDAVSAVDALVHGSELTFRDVARLEDRSHAALRAVPGLHLPTADGWISTGEAKAPVLDELPSPIRMKLLPTDRLVPLELCRGAAPSCATCGTGEPSAAAGVFSEEYLAQELAALRAAGAPGARILDVPLNLSARAFQNLAAAEKRVRFFENAALSTSIDPEHVHDEHLDFLRGVSRAALRARLPPVSRDVPSGAHKPFLESRYAKVIEQLAEFTDIEVEIVLGLPGDGLVAFRRTLERARELPCKVRIVHCLVLPDDLMTRAPASFELRFDPHTLMMRSCLGWTEDALSRERSRLIEMVYREGGEITPEMWSFPGPHEMRRPPLPGTGVVPSGGDIRFDRPSELEPAAQDLQRVLELGIREATSGGWTFVEASARPGEIVVIMKTRDGALVVEMRPAEPEAGAVAHAAPEGEPLEGDRPSGLPPDTVYKVVDGVAFGYRSPRGAKISDGALRLLDRVLQRLHAPARAALGLSQEGEPGSARVRRFRATPS